MSETTWKIKIFNRLRKKKYISIKNKGMSTMYQYQIEKDVFRLFRN